MSQLPLLPTQRTCDEEWGSEVTWLFVCSLPICIFLAPHIPSVLYMDGLCLAHFAIRFLYLVEVNVCVVAKEPETPSPRGPKLTVWFYNHIHLCKHIQIPSSTSHLLVTWIR